MVSDKNLENTKIKLDVQIENKELNLNVNQGMKTSNSEEVNQEDKFLIERFRNETEILKIERKIFRKENENLKLKLIELQSLTHFEQQKQKRDKEFLEIQIKTLQELNIKNQKEISQLQDLKNNFIKKLKAKNEELDMHKKWQEENKSLLQENERIKDLEHKLENLCEMENLCDRKMKKLKSIEFLEVEIMVDKLDAKLDEQKKENLALQEINVKNQKEISELRNSNNDFIKTIKEQNEKLNDYEEKCREETKRLKEENEKIKELEQKLENVCDKGLNQFTTFEKENTVLLNTITKQNINMQ
jgi:hypothetical protein